MTLVAGVSLGFQVILLFLDKFAPVVRPEWIHRAIFYVLGAAALFCTFFKVPLYPAALPVGLMPVVVGLVVLSAVSPLVGLVESVWRKNGQAVYSTGKVQGKSNRFWHHLVTNVLGAVAVSGLVLLAHSMDGFSGFVTTFANDASFNVMLPLTTTVLLAFVRWQQMNECPEIDERIKEPGGIDAITGASLGHGHQWTNLLYLITVTFTAGTTVLYMFAYALQRAKSGDPLRVSWHVYVTIGLAILFFYACGLPSPSEQRAVHLTFLTGTPAALGGALVWLSLFESSLSRNIAALVMVGVGYTIYCMEVVWTTRKATERLQWHYFSAAGVAMVLIGLLGALYMS